MNIDPSTLLRSAQRALLFGVTPIMRYMFIEVGADSRLKMLVVFQKEPDEDQLDLVYSVAAEICGDFVGLDHSDVAVKISNASYEQIKGLKHLVFAVAD